MDSEQSATILQEIEEIVGIQYEGDRRLYLKGRRDIWFKSVLRAIRRFLKYLFDMKIEETYSPGQTIQMEDIKE